jgi:hypothetical protein
MPVSKPELEREANMGHPEEMQQEAPLPLNIAPTKREGDIISGIDDYERACRKT